MSEIILASGSPRRQKLMTDMGLAFSVKPSNYDEHLDESRSAEAVAMELALGKAKDVASRNPDAYVVGSDTVVAVNGRQMEKPIDQADAHEMLTALAGHESTVSTGVAIIHKNKNIQLVKVGTTKVYFKPDSPEVSELREAYLATNDWQDKAGGYGIQSGAHTLIDRIDGDYDTIVGLPTRILARMFEQLGIPTEAVYEPAPVPQSRTSEQA